MASDLKSPQYGGGGGTPFDDFKLHRKPDHSYYGRPR